jgi:hypothetical protein
VERVAEAIGEDLAGKERQEIQKAVQLDLPLVLGEAVLYWAQEELLPIAIEAPQTRKPGWTTANSVDTFSPRSDFEVSRPCA